MAWSLDQASVFSIQQYMPRFATFVHTSSCTINLAPPVGNVIVDDLGRRLHGKVASDCLNEIAIRICESTQVSMVYIFSSQDSSPIK